MSIPVPDTRPLFRPLATEVVRLLRSLSPDTFERPTLAPAWRVRDVVAHMLDTALRRLSYHRDRMPPPPSSRPIVSEQDLAAHINELNALWVRAASRLSTRTLVDLYSVAAAQLCDFVESFPDDAPALFPVSWAGDRGAGGLLDIGREFTEVWHHGAQVREAVGAGRFPDPGWLKAVLAIAVQALPHAYRNVRAAPDASLALEITGDSGGAWTLVREAAEWDVLPGVRSRATARATIPDDVAWRLFFNALAGANADVHLEGDLELARPLLGARAVIV